MITIVGEINLISNDGGRLSSVSTNVVGNNISSDIGDILGSRKNATNPFILGASKLRDGSTFSDNVDYYIGSQLSDKNGIFGTPYEIKVTGAEITSLTIAFNMANGQHPNTITIDGKTYRDDDPIFTITGLAPASAHTITIGNWNTPLYPVVITGIYVNVTIKLDQRNLVSVNSRVFDRGDYKKPDYGIISNYGSLGFIDVDGEIADYAEQGLLTSDVAVELYLKNTLTGKQQPIGKFETSSWDYDNDNREVSVQLKDDLEEWQNIHIEGFSYDPRKPNAVITNSLASLFRWLYANTPDKYNMTGYALLGGVTQNKLSATSMPYPLLESGSLWKQWDKLCKAVGAYIYKDFNGITRFVCL